MKNRLLLIPMMALSLTSWSITPEEKASIVEKIYSRVFSATGTPEEKPKFLFDSKQASKIAYMMKNKDGFPMIGFEEKAFDVCASFGNRRDDAIAFLLGHEISHHLYKHHWGTEFSSAYSVSGLAKDVKEIDRDGIKRFETQADERGGIFCYLAGYDTHGISEKLLRDLYKAYAIDPMNPNYPTLDERIQISKDQDSIVLSYVKVFEAGNYAMLMSEYDAAIDCYEFVIGKSFHSREIYNNLGVVYFLKGLEMAGDHIKYIYPVEIDLEGRVSRGSVKGMVDDETREIFEKALERFEKAYRFDKTYSTAYLNAACVYSILKEYDDAESALKKAQKFAVEEGRKSVENNAKLVLAIVNFQNPQGDKELTKSLLNELVSQNHDFAIYNKSIMDGNEVSDLKKMGRPLGWEGDEVANVATTVSTKAERIEGIKDFSKAELMETESIAITRMDKVICGTRDQSLILQVPISNNEIMIFHTTTSKYTGQMSKGMKLGSVENQLLEAYGLPAVVLSARQGFIYHYPESKMMVLLSQDRCIEKWIVYSKL